MLLLVPKQTAPTGVEPKQLTKKLCERSLKGSARGGSVYVIPLTLQQASQSRCVRERTDIKLLLACNVNDT
jgi:hypothetical protein